MKTVKLLLYSLFFSLFFFNTGHSESLGQLKVESPNKVAGSITPQLIALPASIVTGEIPTFGSFSEFYDLVGQNWDITLTTYSDNGTTVLKKTTKRVSITKNPQTESVSHPVTPVSKTGKVDYYGQLSYKRVSDGETVTSEKGKMTITQTSVTWSAKVYVSNTVSRPNGEIFVGDRVKTYAEITPTISPITEKVKIVTIDMDGRPSSAVDFEDDDENPNIELTNGEKFTSKDFYFKTLESGTDIEINVDLEEWSAYTRTQPDKNDVSKTTFSIKNNPPTLQPIPDQQTTEGNIITFTLLGSDLDPNDVLTYSCLSLPAGATLNSSTGVFEWTPELNQAGTYNLTFSVSDGKGGSDSKNAKITVAPVGSGFADSYPTSGEQIRLILPPNSEFIVDMFVGKAHSITELKYSFQPTGGNLSTNYSLQVTNPGGTSENYSNLTQYNYQKASPTSGFWKIKIKNSSAKNGEILVDAKLASSIIEHYQAVHFTAVVSPGARTGLARVHGSTTVFSVSVGILTGICSPDDYACMGTDIGVGFIPVLGTAKDLTQFTLGAFIGAGMKTVSFFTNDPATSSKADEYFTSAAFAGVGLAGLLVGAYYVDEAAKAAKYAKIAGKMVQNARNFKKLGNLGPVASRLFRNAPKVKIASESSPALRYMNKMDELEKIGAKSGEIHEYRIAAHLASDPEEKVITTVLGRNGDGLNVEIYAKPLTNIPPGEQVAKWDFSTATTTPRSGYTSVTNIDFYGVDKATNKKFMVQVKEGSTKDFIDENAVQIKKIRLALEKSDGFRLELGGGKTEDFEVFGIVGKEMTFQPKIGANGKVEMIVVEADSFYVHQLEPTLPIISGISRSSQGKVIIKFYTEKEFGNKGWYVERRGTKDSVYKTVSSFLFGFNNSSERRDYEFTDLNSDSTNSYLYRLVQMNVENVVTYVSDSLIVSSVTSVQDEELTPKDIFLHQNYPNPFNPSTTLRYSLPSSSEVLIAVSDILGRKVSILEEGIKSAGYHEIIWDAHTLPSGIYFAEIFVNGNSAGRIKMLLTK